MQIQITIHRPWMLLGMVATAVLWYTGFGVSHSQPSVGGEQRGATIAHAQQDIDRERIRKAVLSQREEILRYQLATLEDEVLRSGSDPLLLKRLDDNRAVLLALIKERDQADKLLLASLEQLWEAQGTIFSTSASVGSIVLRWPVEPTLGISATFEDEAYLAKFKVDHHAIDIPTDEGTVIRASADGIVKQVALNGLGYSYIVVEHDGGFETINGHIKGALVKVGDTVHRGDPIALSNGTPGGLGTGLLSTGPHTHFAVKKDGELVDPLKYLEKYKGY